MANRDGKDSRYEYHTPEGKGRGVDRTTHFARSILRDTDGNELDEHGDILERDFLSADDARDFAAEGPGDGGVTEPEHQDFVDSRGESPNPYWHSESYDDGPYYGPDVD